MTTLNDKILSLTPGARIDLYEVDLTKLGGSILYLTPNRETVVPQEVLRFTDNESGSAARFEMAPSFAVPASARLSFECFYRAANPANYPNIVLHTEDYTNRNVFRFRPQTLETNHGWAGSPPISSVSLSIALAGEYFYMRAIGTSPAIPTTLKLSIVPVFANTTAGWSQVNAAIGDCDIAGMRIGYREGGTFIPVLVYMHPNFWIRRTGSNAQTVVSIPPASSAQILKVPVWGGQAYTPIPIEITGFEKMGTGAFPRPRMRMSNLFNEGSALAQEFGDLRGATVRRRRVYADNLDNGPFPDPLASPPADVFVIDRKSNQTNTVIEWELASVLDQQGVNLPGRQILRDTCPFAYRYWNGTAWVYGGEDGCPYTGAAMFNVNGQPVTNPENDKCSHKLKTGCRARYGKKEELPFGGFPMVGRL